MAVITGPVSASGIALEPLFEELLEVAFAPSLDVGDATLRELADAPWVVTRAPNAMRAVLDAEFHRFGMAPNIIAEIDSLPLIIEAVASGLGLTLLPPRSVLADIAAGRLRTRPLGQDQLLRRVALGRSPTLPSSPAVKAVRDLIRTLVS